MSDDDFRTPERRAPGEAESQRGRESPEVKMVAVIVPAGELLPAAATASETAAGALALPTLVRRAGPAAVFAAEKFFYGAIRSRSIPRLVPRVRPGAGHDRPADVGRYFDALRDKNLSVPTRMQHLAAIRHFFRRPGDPACCHPQPGALGERRAL